MVTVVVMVVSVWERIIYEISGMWAGAGPELARHDDSTVWARKSFSLARPGHDQPC